MEAEGYREVITHAHLALLAPVPLVLIEQGRDICRSRGRVAFGSRNWELFRELDELRLGHAVYTLLYASHQGTKASVVSWRGLYDRHVESVGGAHPLGRTLRPPLAHEDGEDRGHWAVFWEVTDLDELPEPIPIADLRSYGGRGHYARSFIPEGPLLIQRP